MLSRFHDAMDPVLLAHARAARGFMPDAEGLALYRAGLVAARSGRGPLLEIGTWCGKSAIYLGAAARVAATVIFTVDHHRGSEENQPGWEHHPADLVDPRVGRIDTLPCFRDTVHDAGLEDAVVGVVGESTTVARFWSTPLAFLFVDGGHGEAVAQSDYTAWAHKLAPAGLLALHDVFEDPADGGQAPFHVWERAVEEGFAPLPELGEGSLRVLRRPR
jgi:predicted O-methyltransferase YrrM